MDIQIDLRKDWAEIIRGVLTERGYTFNNNDSDSEICIKFLNLQRREVSQCVRTVYKSRSFVCPENLQAGLKEIERRIQNGESLDPYLSRRMKNLDYNDFMLNDWGIFHLHLGTEFESDGYIKRTDELLYLRIDNEAAYFIGVYNHGNWTKQDMIRILHENWPKSIETFIIKDVKPVGSIPTDDDLKNMRKIHVNTFVKIDDSTQYAPLGWGNTGSGSSVQAQMNYIHYARIIDKAEKCIKDNSDRFFSDAQGKVTKPISTLIFRLIINGYDLFVREENSGCVYKI